MIANSVCITPDEQFFQVMTLCDDQLDMKSQPAPGSQLQVREPGAGSRFDLNLELE